MIFYHLTSLLHLPRILKDKILTTTESNIGSPITQGAHYGPDVVWLFKDLDTVYQYDHGIGPHVARGAKKIRGLSDKVIIPDKKQVQFAVDVPEGWVKRWVNWCWLQGIDHNWYDYMVEAGGGKKAAEQWYVSLRPIPEENWVEVIDTKKGLKLWTPGKED